jgi:DNA anti-recombination protein RmuC
MIARKWIVSYNVEGSSYVAVLLTIPEFSWRAEENQEKIQSIWSLGQQLYLDVWDMQQEYPTVDRGFRLQLRDTRIAWTSI